MNNNLSKNETSWTTLSDFHKKRQFNEYILNVWTWQTDVSLAGNKTFATWMQQIRASKPFVGWNFVTARQRRNICKEKPDWWGVGKKAKRAEGKNKEC